MDTRKQGWKANRDDTQRTSLPTHGPLQFREAQQGHLLHTLCYGDDTRHDIRNLHDRNRGQEADDPGGEAMAGVADGATVEDERG